MRALVKTAVDDTGCDLVDHEKEIKEFNGLNSGQNNWLQLKLKNPARKAGTIKELSGEVELYVPKNDPESILSVESFQKVCGKPIEAAVLTEAGIKIIAYTKEQSDAIRAKKVDDPEAFEDMSHLSMGAQNAITLRIHDPNLKLIGIVFQNADGKKILSNGGGCGFKDNRQLKICTFNSQLPENARIVIYIATSKSVIKAPFSLLNVVLP